MKRPTIIEIVMIFIAGILIGNLLVAIWGGYSGWRDYQDAVIGIVIAYAQIWGKERKKEDHSQRIKRLDDKLKHFYSPLLGRLNEPDPRKDAMYESFIREKFSQCNVKERYMMYAEPDSLPVIKRFFTSNSLVGVNEWKAYFNELLFKLGSDYYRLKSEFDLLTS